MAAAVTAVEVIGTPGDETAHGDIVTVIAHYTLRVRFSRETFKLMFPHVLSNESLLQCLIGMEVEYPSIKRFQFASDGRIAVKRVDVDFVKGLVDTGCTISDVAVLTGGAAIKPESMIVDVEDEEHETASESVGEAPHRRTIFATSTNGSTTPVLDKIGQPEGEDEAQSNHRLSVAYLLSSPDDMRTRGVQTA